MINKKVIKEAKPNTAIKLKTVLIMLSVVIVIQILALSLLLGSLNQIYKSLNMYGEFSSNLMLSGKVPKNQTAAEQCQQTASPPPLSSDTLPIKKTPTK